MEQISSVEEAISAMAMDEVAEGKEAEEEEEKLDVVNEMAMNAFPGELAAMGGVGGLGGMGAMGGVVRRQPARSPLESNRQWYRGQWLDALDTVNQWLEATVVDIVLPSDILPNYNANVGGGNSARAGEGRRRKTRRRTPDAVVSANDLEGRRRLLLEPRPESEERGELGEREEGGSSAGNSGISGSGGSRFYGLLDEGYRERDDNDGVQLLLIHYNGWPHRWDEWIRSDSERIRPFRTRTRHRSTVSSIVHSTLPCGLELCWFYN